MPPTVLDKPGIAVRLQARKTDLFCYLNVHCDTGAHPAYQSPNPGGFSNKDEATGGVKLTAYLHYRRG
jgi:hypothetical protein